jgi:predicted adenine nucleotide alpha hydrolase (AANH) superfamily ATPase
MRWISQWNNNPYCEGMDLMALSRMCQLRRQILLHSYLYYGLNENIWADHEWDKRAKELHQLQTEHGWNINFYDEIFKGWTGQSGYWLPTNKVGLDTNIDRVARRILAYDKLLAEQGSTKTSLGHIPKEIA